MHCACVKYECTAIHTYIIYLLPLQFFRAVDDLVFVAGEFCSALLQVSIHNCQLVGKQAASFTYCQSRPDLQLYQSMKTSAIAPTAAARRASIKMNELVRAKSDHVPHKRTVTNKKN